MSEPKIYIWTNRVVKDGRIDNKGNEPATESFAVARVTDFDSMDYEILLPDSNGTPPSKQMVEELHSDNGDTLVFIHGFANTFKDNQDHIRKLKKLYLDNPKHSIKNLVYVSWSSTGSLLRYGNDSKDAFKTGQCLGRMFEYLGEYLMEMPECGNNYYLLAHSMGNQVLQHTIKSISNPFPFFKAIALLHADIDWDVFSKEETFYMKNVNKLARRTIIVTDEQDVVLSKISRYTKNNGVPRLGNGVFGKLPVRVRQLDVTHLNLADTFREKNLDHWGYLEDTMARPMINNEIFK